MSRPIGVFDSGVGGLTVLRELNAMLPRESTIYLGDNTRVPYGALPAETIREYALECLDYLRQLGVKAMVIACNAATTAALGAARGRYDVPVIGVIEPTAWTAAEVAGSRVGVVGTEATVNGGEYVRIIASRKPLLEVFQQPCPLLALRVEAGEFATRDTERLLEGYLEPLREQGVDTLVLGCTHYTFVRPLIERLMGPSVQIVESPRSTVGSLAALMDVGELEAAGGGEPLRRILTTGKVEAFRRVAAALWPEGLPPIEEVGIEVVRGLVRR